MAAHVVVVVVECHGQPVCRPLYIRRMEAGRVEPALVETVVRYVV
jgi:hypothetical protein